VYGNLIFSLSPENTVEVRGKPTALTAIPDGVTPKFGRFLSGIGYLRSAPARLDRRAAAVPEAFRRQFKNDGLQVRDRALDVRRVRRGDR
jgi:hypothetical protein